MLPSEGVRLMRSRRISAFGRHCRAAMAGAALLLVGGLLAAACGDSDDTSSDTAAPAAMEMLDLGLMAELSGEWVIYGTPWADGVRLAVAQVNEAGGFEVDGQRYGFNLIEVDNRSDTTASVAAATELVEDRGVKYLFGPPLDFFSPLVADITQPAEVLFFAPSTVLSERLSRESTAPGGDSQFIFKTHIVEPTRQEVIARGVFEFLPLTRHTLLIPNEPVGQGIEGLWADAMSEAGKRAGLEPEMETILYPPETTDFAPLLTRARATNPDMLHVWYNPDVAISALQLGIELDVADAYLLLSVDPFNFRDVFGAVDVDVLLVCLPGCHGEPAGEAAERYWDAFDEQGGTFGPGAGVSLMSHDFVFMLAQAMNAAGTVDDTAAIAEQLRSITYEPGGLVGDTGVMGGMTFDETNTAIHGLDICHARGEEMNCTHILPGEGS